MTWLVTLRRKNPPSWEPCPGRVFGRLHHQLYEHEKAGRAKVVRTETRSGNYDNWTYETDAGRYPKRWGSAVMPWAEITFSIEGVPLLRETWRPGKREYFYNPDMRWDFNAKSAYDQIVKLTKKKNPPGSLYFRNRGKVYRLDTETTEAPNLFGHTYYWLIWRLFHNDRQIGDGRFIGENNRWHERQANIQKVFQGRRLYPTILKILRRRFGPLSSDSQLSDGAVKAWERTRGVTINEDSGIFELNPPRPAITIVRPITRELAIDLIGQQDLRGRRKKKHHEPGWYMDMVPAGQLFLVDVPVSALYAYDDRPEIIFHYAKRTTPFPPITVHPANLNGGPLVLNVWQGNHRAVAAKRRGDKTIRAIMSRAGIERWRKG